MTATGLYHVVELAFEAEETKLNPYVELRLDVAFRSPTGRTLHVAGFWEEGRRWAARFSPDEIGRWSWRSESNDQGLRDVAGEFDVGNATGNSSWRNHGPLSVHASGRGFAHADGTPLFWLADTVWAAPAHATIEEWLEFVAHRSRQGFNVLQINALPQWDASGPPQRLPFTIVDGQDDLTRPDPEYFRFLDQVVSAAADAGMICAMVVLWFENTPDDNEHWSVKVPRRGPFTKETAQLFAKFLTARYEAFGTTWIISGDSSFATPGCMALYDVAAETISKTSARPPVMTAHLNGSTPPPVALNARPWIDYHMFQSCHFRDSPERAQRYAADARAFLPGRPVLNGEPCYDGLRQMDPSNVSGQRFNRADVRKASWVSVLSGASAGLTYGAHGTWPWHRQGQDYGPIHYGIPLDWRRALVLESGDDVSRLKQFFSRLPWWELEPASGIIAEEAESLIATARTGGDRYVLAYVGRAARLRLPAALAADRSGAWFDPATGSWSQAQIEQTEQGWSVSPCKVDGEAILELRAKRSVLPGAMGLDHIALATGDLTASVSFYTDVLGFALTYRKTLEGRHLDYAFLELGSCRLEILQPLVGFDGPLTPVLNHFAIAVDDLETLVEELRARGVAFSEPTIAVIPELFSGGARGAFLTGPSGERIELFERTR